jgi:competence protein ComEA
VSKRPHHRAASTGATADRLRRLRAGGWPEPGAEGDLSSDAERDLTSFAELNADGARGAEAVRSVGGNPVTARLPPPLRHGVLDPGRRGLAALTCLALVGAVLGGWFFLRARPSEAQGADPQGAAYSTGAGGSLGAASTPTASLPRLPSGWATDGSSSPAQTAPAQVVVDVVGRVRHPGVVAVEAGSRIDDVITVAGGALPGTDLTGLDLAARVSDGEEIFVGIPPPTGGAMASAGGVVAGPDPGGQGVPGASSGPAVVDLNSAGLTELETLPGVGAVLGQRILDWRAAHGRFGSVAQLQQVAGIGPSKYAALAGRVTV